MVLSARHLRYQRRGCSKLLRHCCDDESVGGCLRAGGGGQLHAAADPAVAVTAAT